MRSMIAGQRGLANAEIGRESHLIEALEGKVGLVKRSRIIIRKLTDLNLPILFYPFFYRGSYRGHCRRKRIQAIW